MDPELHLGGCLCDNWELRVTERCLIEDLALTRETSFEEALGHPIVRAFKVQRANDPGSGDTVGPRAGRNTLFTLRHRHDHRGATLYDPDEGVVWLCAYGRHRSGEPDDAFALFRELIRDHRISPTPDDYLRLGRERKRRFRDRLPAAAEAALRDALAHPGTSRNLTLARELPIRLAAAHAGDLIELEVAFPAPTYERQRGSQVLAALAADEDPAWEPVWQVAGEATHDEIAFRMYRNPL